MPDSDKSSFHYELLYTTREGANQAVVSWLMGQFCLCHVPVNWWAVLFIEIINKRESLYTEQHAATPDSKFILVTWAQNEAALQFVWGSV